MRMLVGLTKEKRTRQKRIVACAADVLWLGMIFSQSLRTAEESSQHSGRLTQLLQRQGIHVHVQPCVLFVSEAASVYVQPPEMLESGGRRARISACLRNSPPATPPFCWVRR